MIVVISGSKSDRSVVESTLEEFRNFPVKISYYVASAHRSPDKLKVLVKLLEQEGVSVIIAVAGHAAHLAGAIAAQTLIPVYGVPLATSELQGVDSLYSMVMMPSGVPVATFGHGKTGLKNALLLAIAHLAKQDGKLKSVLSEYRKQLAESVSDGKPLWTNG